MPRLIPERATSFAAGFNDTAAPTDYKPNEVRLMENCRPSFAGTAVERRDGSRKMHSTALNSGAFCWGAIEYFTPAGAQQIVAFFGDTFQVSTDGGATWTDSSGAVNITEDWWTFATMRVGNDEFLFCANGGTDILQWDGTTLSVLAATQGSVPTGVKFVTVANDRLYAAGHNGHELHATNVGDPTNWDTTQGAFTVRVQTHDGDTDIRGMYQFGAALLVWKRRSTNYIEGFGVRTLEVESGPRGASRSVGCAGHRTIAAVGSNGVMWLSERGFEYFDGGRIQLVSRRQQRFVDTINWAAIADDPLRPVAIYVERKHEYWCVVPRTLQNTAIYAFRLPQVGAPAAAYIFRRADIEATTGDHLDTDGDGYVFIETPPAGFTTSLDDDGYQAIDDGQSGDTVEVDSDGYVSIVAADTLGGVLFTANTEDDVGVPHEGTADGFIMRLDDGDTDFAEPDRTGGNPITMRLEGRPFLYGDVVQRKKARHMRATLAAPKAATVTMKVEVDGVVEFDRSVSVPTASESQPVGVRERVKGRGRAIVPIIETTNRLKVLALEVEAYFMRRN